ISAISAAVSAATICWCTRIYTITVLSWCSTADSEEFALKECRNKCTCIKKLLHCFAESSGLFFNYLCRIHLDRGSQNFADSCDSLHTLKVGRRDFHNCESVQFTHYTFTKYLVVSIALWEADNV